MFVYDRETMENLGADIDSIKKDLYVKLDEMNKLIKNLTDELQTLYSQKPTVPTRPTMPSTTGLTPEAASAAMSSYNAAMAAYAAAQQRLAEWQAKVNKLNADKTEAESQKANIQKDVNAVEEISKTINGILETVHAVETDVVGYTLKQLVGLQKLSTVSVDVATNIIDAIHDNSVAHTGSRYVECRYNGETIKVYTDLYKDIDGDKYKKYVSLAKTLGVEATMAIMDANGESTEFAFGVASATNNGVVDTEKIRDIFNLDNGTVTNKDVVTALNVKAAPTVINGKIDDREKINVFSSDGTTVYAYGSLDGAGDVYTGNKVHMENTAYESAECFGYNTTQSNIINDTLESGGYTYIDENGLYRSAKTAGVKSDDDYYIVALGNGFGQAAAQVDSHCTEIKEFSWGDAYKNTTGVQGAVQTGYTFEVTLQDTNGNTYSIDVMMGDIKASKGATLFPHDVPVEFVVDGKPGSEVSTGGNVDWQKLVGGTGLTEVTGISAYADGARYTTNYITGGLEHAVYD